MKARITIAAAALSASAGLLGAAGACSGGGMTAPCGAGTTVQGSQCVPSDASAEGTLQHEGGPPADAPPASDSPLGGESSSKMDSATPDATGSEGGDAGPPSDPCLGAASYSLSCDPTCLDPTGSTAQCGKAKCGPTVTVNMPGASAFPTFVRTPDAPGFDPNCATECPSENWAYGIGLQMTGVTSAWTVKVGAPWVLVTAQTGPYCADPAFTPSNCATISPFTTGSFFVMTKDPNAPSRNVEFDYATQLTCP